MAESTKMHNTHRRDYSNVKEGTVRRRKSKEEGRKSRNKGVAWTKR